MKRLPATPNSIRYYRQAKDWTQDDLAIKLDVSVSTIQQWEQGKKRPGKLLIDRLIELLDVPEGESEDFKRIYRQNPGSISDRLSHTHDRLEQSTNTKSKNNSEQLDNRNMVSRKIGSRVAAQDLFYTAREGSEFETLLQDAKEVCLVGRSLVSIFDNVDMFVKIARDNNCRFRILLPDAKRVKASLVYAKPFVKQFKKNIETTREMIDFLRYSVNPDLIDVRVLVHAPTLGLTIIDGQETNGQIIVQLFPYGSLTPTRPHFDVFPDDKYYAIFQKHFEDLWELAET